MSVFSVAAYLSPLGCSIEQKGLFSLALAGMLVVYFRQISMFRIVQKTFVSSGILYLVAFFLILDFFNFGIRDILFGASKGSGTYSETSHLAMYLLPIVGFRLLLSPRDKLTLLVLVVSFILAPSSVLLVGTLGIICLYMLDIKRRKLEGFLFLLLLFFVFFSFLYFGVIEMTNTLNRIKNVVEWPQANVIDHTNLSSIVWLNGWSQAFQTFNETNWLGTGFNQMGCGKFYEIGSFSPLILNEIGVVLNAEDGSLLAAKMIAELGVFGGIVVVGLAIFSVRAICQLRSYKNDNISVESFVMKIRAVGGLCVLIYLFVRGVGYFQLPFLVALSMLSASLRQTLIKEQS